MAWKKNYSAARNATWVWYLFAVASFAMAIKAAPIDGQSALPFVFWVAISSGLVFSAGRAKRKAMAKARG